MRLCSGAGPGDAARRCRGADGTRSGEGAKRRSLTALSERATPHYGLLLALLLGAALAALLAHDRSARLDAAERETATLAEATSGLVHYAMRDIERSLLSAARGSARLAGDRDAG
jgi:hypothetical protein